MPGPRVGRARVRAVHVSIASPVAFEAFGHWEISRVREGLDAALEFLQDPAIHHALARVAVGVVEQARGDLTLDGADVPEAFRAHERVASIVLLLDAHARGLAQHALALGKVPRREQPAASVRVRSRHGDVAVAWIVWQEEAVVVGSGVLIRRRREQELELPSRDRVEVGVRHVRIFGIELKRIERVRGRRDVPVESRAVCVMRLALRKRGARSYGRRRRDL